MIEKEHILDEIKRTAIDGKALGKARFEAETGITEGDWSGRYWARWNDAVEEAGFEPNLLQGLKYTDDEVLRLLATETRRLGHLPTDAELRLRRRQDDQFPGASVFGRRFGSKEERTRRLIEFCRNDSGYNDVLAVVEPLLDAAQATADSTDEAALGYVYMLKSGRNYKLGRTNSLGRREYELAIQLPERAESVHSIKTDDPAGIEAYWHRRFADRRKNGEWFELTAADVRAFKRRKFM